MKIIVDLETAALDNVAALIEPVTRAPKTYKKPEAIADYIAEANRKQIEDAALNPFTNRIIALGWCHETDDVEYVELANCESRERALITEFRDRIMDEQRYVTPLVTFNGLRFDLPVLMVRALLLGVDFPELSLDRYRSPHLDLSNKLSFNGALDYRSLKWYARRLGLNVDDAFSGAETAQLLEDQNWDAIRSHCASDVRLTRQIGERLGLLRRRPVAAAQKGAPF